MRDIRTMNMTEGQKIESDTVMKRLGDLAYRNFGTFAKTFLFDSGKVLIVGDGLRVEPSSLMTVTVPTGSVFQRFVDVIPCLQNESQAVTLAAASGSPRIDIIEAQITSSTDKDEVVQVGTVITGTALTVTNQSIKRDIKYYLSARKQTGTTTATVATAGILTGTVAIAGTIDLSTEYLLNLSDGEDGSFQEIDCRGVTPAATTRAEIIANINSAVGRTMAADGAGNVIELTGNETGQASMFTIKPPSTDSDKDCLQIVFGVSIGGVYKYTYEGTNEWFKLAEIDVGAATTTITSGLIRNIDQKITWSDRGSDLLLFNPLFGNIFENLSNNNEIRYTGISKAQWTFAQVVGSGLSLSTVGGPALAALNGTDVAYIDGTTEDLGTYRFDGSNWSLVGSVLNISGIINPALTALNGTDIAFLDGTIEELRTYRFDGSNWSLVGSGLSISGVEYPALAALSGTDVAFIDGLVEELRTYRFDGSNWSLVGSGLSISGIVYPALTALNGTDVAYLDDTIEELRTYRFDGSNWSLVGSGLSISGISNSTLASLNGTDVAFLDQTIEELRTYRFDGSNWSLVGSGLSISGIIDPVLTALNGTDVVYIDNAIEELTTYRFGFSISGLPYNPSNPDFS